MTQYKIVRAYHKELDSAFDDLDIAVNEWIGEGWVPHGSLQIQNQLSNTGHGIVEWWVVIQTMMMLSEDQANG